MPSSAYRKRFCGNGRTIHSPPQRRTFTSDPGCRKSIFSATRTSKCSCRTVVWWERVKASTVKSRRLWRPSLGINIWMRLHWSIAGWESSYTIISWQKTESLKPFVVRWSQGLLEDLMKRENENFSYLMSVALSNWLGCGGKQKSLPIYP